MGSPLTKELAESAARKLEAEIEPGRRRDLAKVYHEGKLVAQFGIRRGSDRNMLHNYIAPQLHVSQREAYLLGKCPLSREEWLDIMRSKGLLA